MQHAQTRTRSRRWIGQGALVAGLAVFAISPALPAMAASWSSPVPLPGSCGGSVAVNQAGAMAAGGTFTASDGATHVQVCTSANGKTWQATDLGQGGNAPSSGHRIVVAVTPAGQTVALWGNWPCSTCTAVLEAAVHPDFQLLAVRQRVRDRLASYHMFNSDSPLNYLPGLCSGCGWNTTTTRSE